MNFHTVNKICMNRPTSEIFLRTRILDEISRPATVPLPKVPARFCSTCYAKETLMKLPTETQDRSFQFNNLKLRALEIFKRHGPMNPPTWAILAKFFPIRASYSYLLRLHRFGLLNRTRDHCGLLLYSLSDRGRERLIWLSIPHRPKPSLPKPEVTTRGV